MPVLSIVILSHNRLADLRANLEYLLAAGREDWEIIVVDNASTDGTPEYLAGLGHPRLTVVANPENRGVAGGRNDGFRLAKGEFIVCIDDDSQPELGFLNDLPALFAAYPEAGLITPLVLHAQDGTPQNDHGMDPMWVSNFHGSCHAFRRSLLDEIGYQDELCTFGGEEIDFSVRAHKAGYHTLYHPEYVSRHNSFVRPPAEQMKRWHRWAYNYARVLGKNFPPEMAKKLADEHTRQFALKLARAGQPRGSQTIAQEGLRGLLEGLAANEHCPVETQRFYSNPDLAPEFGNKTLLRKIWHKVAKPGPARDLLAGRRKLA